MQVFQRLYSRQARQKIKGNTRFLTDEYSSLSCIDISQLGPITAVLRVQQLNIWQDSHRS